MATIHSEFETRVRVLERQLRWMQVLLTIVVLAVAVSAFFSGAVQAQHQKALRLRTLVVEDAAGRDRIVFGAPLPDPQGRVSPSTGMVINDPEGVDHDLLSACMTTAALSWDSTRRQGLATRETANASHSLPMPPVVRISGF